MCAYVSVSVGKCVYLWVKDFCEFAEGERIIGSKKFNLVYFFIVTHTRIHKIHTYTHKILLHTYTDKKTNTHTKNCCRCRIKQARVIHYEITIFKN